MERKAEEHISNGNYTRALKIYERLIDDWKARDPAGSIPHVLLLGKANCLALIGRFRESFEFFLKAFKGGQVDPDQLCTFSNALVQFTRASILTSPVRTPQTFYTFLQCASCTGIALDPVTITCGHTCCKVCAERKSAEDLCCEERISGSSTRWKINVVLQGFLQKYFPVELEASRLRLKGNELYTDKNMEGALEKYQQAFDLCQTDHLIQSNLSHVLCIHGQFEQALERAEDACRLKPKWPKGYYRQGCALIGLGRKGDAIVALVHCLARQRDNASVRNSLVKVIHELFSSASATLNDNNEEFRMNHGTNSNALKGRPKEYQELLDLITKPSQNGKAYQSRFHLTGEQLLEKLKAKGPVCEDDFECTLCCRLYYEPVTTPCGHTFCRTCLNRNLDHRPCCPICRFLLHQYLAERKQNVTLAIDVTLKELLPMKYDERKKQHENEMEQLASVAQDTADDIPVFVCALALPGLSCPLHIFEPRYRLMVRQCMESGSRQFGMCIPCQETSFLDYGVMLEIQDVQYLTDGRSFVDTVGGRRFKVLKRGMRDGYHTAKVEWIKDKPVPTDEVESLSTLHQTVYSGAQQWFDSLPLQIRRRIVNSSNGEMPHLESNPLQLAQGPAWLWWMVSVCPISTETQIAMLAVTSLRERLLQLQQIIAALQLQPFNP